MEIPNAELEPGLLPITTDIRLRLPKRAENSCVGKAVELGERPRDLTRRVTTILREEVREAERKARVVYTNCKQRRLISRSRHLH